VLSNLLPGLRDLRAPLSAGFIWLLALYIAFEPLVSRVDRTHGIWLTLSNLERTFTAVGAGVALTFGAYLCGAISEAVLGTASRAFVSSLTRGLVGLTHFVVDHAPRRVLSQHLVEESRSRDVVPTALRVHGSFGDIRVAGTTSEYHRTAVGGAGRLAVGQLADEGVDTLREALAQHQLSLGHIVVNEIVARERTVPGFAVRQVDPQIERALRPVRPLVARTANKIESAVLTDTATKSPEAGRAVLTSLRLGSSDDELVLPIVKSELRGDIVGDLGLVRTQLLGKEPELFAEVDRLRSEADLRVEIIAPLIALAAALAWRAAIWAGALAFVAALILGLSGHHRAEHGNDALIEALRLHRAESPTVARINQVAHDLAEIEPAGPPSERPVRQQP
jgi:hypothetical protein